MPRVTYIMVKIKKAAFIPPDQPKKTKKVRVKRLRIRSDKPIEKNAKVNQWVRTTKKPDPNSKRYEMFIVREMDKQTAFLDPVKVQRFTTRDVIDRLTDVIENQYPKKNVTDASLTNIMQRLKNEGYVEVISSKTKIYVKPSSEWEIGKMARLRKEKESKCNVDDDDDSGYGFFGDDIGFDVKKYNSMSKEEKIKFNEKK